MLERMFQFLLGRLETDDRFLAFIYELEFQFLLGRLETENHRPSSRRGEGFNSS